MDTENIQAESAQSQRGEYLDTARSIEELNTVNSEIRRYENMPCQTAPDEIYVLSKLEPLRLRRSELLAHIGCDPFEEPNWNDGDGDTLQHFEKSTTAPVVASNDGPAPLTRNEIANCFAGLRGWDVTRWQHELSSPDCWLKDCQQRKGTRGRGGYQSTWWPVCIATALVERNDTSAKLVSAKFKNQEPLKPWLDTWQTYCPDDV